MVISRKEVILEVGEVFLGKKNHLGGFLVIFDFLVFSLGFEVVRMARRRQVCGI